MRFCSEKPIRVDYYPKTKEDVDESEKLEVEDIIDRGAICEITDKKEFVEEKITKCNSCVSKDVEVMEKAMKEITEDIEKVIEEVAEDEK